MVTEKNTLRQKVRSLWETKGYILVLALCVAVLGGTALVSRSARSGNAPPIATPYLSDTDLQGELIPALPLYTPPITASPAQGDTAEAGASLNAKPAVSLIAPTDGTYGMRFSADSLVYLRTLDAWGTHTGLDIQADEAQAVRAVMAGTVTAITDDAINGLCVDILHSNGMTSRYMGLSGTEGIQKGTTVTAGQIIGRVGVMPSERDEGPYLHFELLGTAGYIDPEPLLNPLEK